MSKVKIIMMSLVAVFVFGALASASASAATAGWMVNGTLLSGLATLAPTAKVDKPGRLHAVGVEIECSGELNGVEPMLESPNMATIARLTFTGCKSTAENCTLAGEPNATISTVPLLVEATLEGTLAAVATFSPKTKTTFATFNYEGAKCGLKGLNSVTGHAKVLAPTGQDERTLQQINVITEESSGELKVGSSGAGLEGSALLQLASGQTWSFL